MSKLHAFSILKQNNLFEKYLISVQNVSDRIALTRFRLSNHTLMIEKGRHRDTKIPKLFDRTCPFCPGHVEDEFHFLIKCQTFRTLRQKLLEEIQMITIGFYYPNEEQFLFWFLLNNPNISHLTARYIKSSMDLRAFLLDNHRNYT